jgi:hypothetical protein
MNNPLHHLEDYPSYQLHRRQLWTQILLPILIAAPVFIAVIIITSLATFRGNGDVNRWAAISTMWLILPIMIASLIFLMLLIAMIYLMARITALIPQYAHQAQRIMYRIEGGIKHVVKLIKKPVLAFQGLVMLIKTYMQKVHERM